LHRCRVALYGGVNPFRSKPFFAFALRRFFTVNILKTIHRGFLFVPVFFAVFLLALPAQAAPRTAELIADAQTGRILHGSNIYSLRHPASLTKVMTLYLAFSAIENGRFSMNSMLPVSYRAAIQRPSKLGLTPGSRIRMRDAILGLITVSANDAAVVLAEAIGGSEKRFAQIMTAEAKALGMKRTVYRNPNGLPDASQVTTAFDQAILTRAMMAHFPQYYGLFSTEEFTYAGVTRHNHNRLMGYYEGMDGIKTGFINASGFNLIASAKRGDQRLIGVVFGGKTAKKRDNRMAQLLDSGFERMVADVRSSKYGQVPSVETTADAVDVSKDDSQEYQLAEGVNSTAQGDVDEEAQEETVAAKKNWSVQIGSYKSRKQGLSAVTLAKKKTSELKNAQTRIVQVKTKRGRIYRARLTGMYEEDARQACDTLSAKGYGNCVALAPRG
jgi:D-alanyl-D-alanine carboxypeptidase